MVSEQASSRSAAPGPLWAGLDDNDDDDNGQRNKHHHQQDYDDVTPIPILIPLGGFSSLSS